ncbi:CHAT domain-containing protein [Xylariales sp. PMI_506]|nr:CHAT domain-containing protein [Xylariales sp. PMI_506]
MDRPIRFGRQPGLELTEDEKELRPLVERALQFMSNDPVQRMMVLRPMLALEELQRYDVLISTVQAGLNNNPDISSKGQYLNDLATLFERKYDVTRSIDDLQAAIQPILKQIEFLKSQHEYGQLVFAYKKLDELLKRELNVTQSLETANAIVDHAREGLALFPESLRSHSRVMLDYALHSRFVRTGSVDDLEESIHCLRTSFNQLKGENLKIAGVDWGEVLGHALNDRYQLTGSAKDLQALIRSDVLSLTPPGHKQRSAALNHVSLVYIGQYHLSKDLSKLSDAEAVLLEARDLTKDKDPHRAAVLVNLGCCYESRYHGTGSRGDLDTAIKAYADAADAALYRDDLRLISRQNLETVLVQRYMRTGSRDDLVTAVNSLQSTAESLPKDHPWRFRVLHSLAQCYLEVSEYQETDEDRLGYYEQAIDALRDASEVLSIAAGRDGFLLSALAGALMKQYSITGDKSSFASAVRSIMRSIDKIRAGSPELSSRLDTLANILHMEFHKNKDAGVLDKAVETAKQAVQVATSQSRGHHLFLLGKCLKSRYDLKGSVTDKAEAIDTFSECLDNGSAPTELRIRAARLGAKLTGPDQLNQAYKMLSAATELLPIASPRAFYRQDHQYALAASAGIAGDAASLAMRSGQGPEQVLRLLEIGRGVIISSQLETRSDITDLEEAHPELALKFRYLQEACHQQLSIPSTSFQRVEGAVRNSVLQVARRNQPFAEQDARIDEIRSQTDFENFLLPPSAEQMMKLARTAPIVYLNPSRYGCDAFIIQEHKIKHITLDNLSFSKVEENSTALMEILKNDSLRTRKQSNRVLRKLLEWLWDDAVGPILCELGATATPESQSKWLRVCWIPVGLLSLFPIHAAGYFEESNSAPDRVISSYIPTTKALKYAMEASTAARKSFQTEPPSFLMVAMPNTPGYSPLPFTTAEVAAIDALLPAHVSRNTLQTPSRAEAIAAVRDAAVVHFSCHGVVSPDPSRSAILLSDWQTAPLSAEDIARLPLRQARLAFLSACHSASNVSLALLDEAIHLAGAWAMAGFHSVIGTLWHVDDAVSADVAASFYAALVVAKNVSGQNTVNSKDEFDFEAGARSLHFAVRKVLEKKRRSRRDDLMTWAAYMYTGI